MFVPLGILLPLCSRWHKKFYRTYLTGLAFTIAIELIQLVSRRGIFELDDIFNNLLGTMIGYGIYRLCSWIYSIAVPIPKRERLRPVLLFQLPFVFAAALFGTIFTVYRLQEFGNLSQRYISKVDMSNVELTIHTELSNETAEVPVYQMHVASVDETYALAQELFAKLDTQVDENETDIYDETAVYYSPGRKYCVWIDYAGCTMDFTDFSETYKENGTPAAGKAGCSRSEIETALAQFGIQVPIEADFLDKGGGTYICTVEEIDTGGLCKGSISCTYNEHGKISSFHNGMITYQKPRECEIISEQEAYGQIQAGKFRGEDYSYDQKIASIEIDTAALTYAADSKGFDQPVYSFRGRVNGEAAEIQIPALE